MSQNLLLAAVVIGALRAKYEPELQVNKLLCEVSVPVSHGRVHMTFSECYYGLEKFVSYAIILMKHVQYDNIGQ